MEYFELVEKRYSVRKFKEEDIPDADIEKIIGVAGIAPSGKNLQHWHFVVIKNKNVRQSMAAAVKDRFEIIAEGLPEEQGTLFKKFSRFATFFVDAPVVVAVYAGEYIPEGFSEQVASNDEQKNIDRLTEANPGMQSIGGAIEQMILAALNMGYGSCWMTSPNNAGLLEEIIGFKKDNFKLVALVPMGVAEGDRRSPIKKDISEIMTMIK